jgi:hypothetical protein
MSVCAGLHCPGCSEGQSLGILGSVATGILVADQTVRWVADRIWWIGGTLAVSYAIAVAVTMWLERRADARGVRYAELHGIASRADIDELTPAGVAWLASRDQPRALGATVINLSFYGADAEASAVRVIRQALPGQAGEAITEGEERT